MKKTFVTLITGVLLGNATLASANLYLSGTVGNTDYNVPTFEDGTSVEATLGFRLAPNLALEASYIDLGEADDNVFPNWTLSGEGVTAAVRVSAPINDQLEIYGKAGLFFWEASLEQQGLGEIASDEGTDLMLGAGLSLALSHQLDLIAEYKRLEFDGEDVDNVSVGLQLNF